VCVTQSERESERERVSERVRVRVRVCVCVCERERPCNLGSTHTQHQQTVAHLKKKVSKKKIDTTVLWPQGAGHPKKKGVFPYLAFFLFWPFFMFPTFVSNPPKLVKRQVK
jgi:hypothetical protein